MKRIVSTEKAPAALGAYSQGTVFNGAVQGARLVFTAGQLGMDPATGKLAGGGIAAQTRQALENLKAVLVAGGASLDGVLKVTVFLADIKDFAAMNEVYSQFFVKNPPARSAFQVAALPKGALVEIECIAAAS